MIFEPVDIHKEQDHTFLDTFTVISVEDWNVADKIYRHSLV